jgi:hypothetical protein
VLPAYNNGMMPVEAGYHLPLGTVDGEIHTIFVSGVDEIATDIQHSIIDMSMVEEFPEDVQGLAGPVDMLIGFDNHGVFLVEKARKESMALWSSRFKMLARRTSTGCACNECSCGAVAVTANFAMAAFKPLDFISTEALGTVTQAHSAALRNHKECKLRVDFMSFKATKAILNELTLVEKWKKLTASNPFCISP